MADQENALQQVQPDISIKESSGPTFIGDNASVNVTVYHHHPPGNFLLLFVEYKMESSFMEVTLMSGNTNCASRTAP